jgi:hypothetical protein
MELRIPRPKIKGKMRVAPWLFNKIALCADVDCGKDGMKEFPISVGLDKEDAKHVCDMLNEWAGK